MCRRGRRGAEGDRCVGGGGGGEGGGEEGGGDYASSKTKTKQNKKLQQLPFLLLWTPHLEFTSTRP